MLYVSKNGFFETTASYDDVVNYLIVHLLLDVETDSHLPLHWTVEETEVQKGSGTYQRLTSSWKENLSGLWGDVSAESGRAGHPGELLPARAEEPGTPANASRKACFYPETKKCQKNPGKDSALGAFKGSWHLVDAHYSLLTQSAVDVLKEVGKAIFKKKEKQCCIHWHTSTVYTCLSGPYIVCVCLSRWGAFVGLLWIDSNEWACKKTTGCFVCWVRAGNSLMWLFSGMASFQFYSCASARESVSWGRPGQR